MNRLILTSFVLLNSISTFSQNFTNAWIDYGKQYYKFQITEEGIYRIGVNELLGAGIPTGAIDPQGIQLYFRGEEQHIYVEGEADGVLDAGDYIEFYGLGNDGWLDTVLYSDPEWHANDDYSLYTDTSTYFLTWDNSTTGKRVSIETDTNFASYAAASYFLKKNRQNYTTNYYLGPYENGGQVHPAEFEEGEGWFSTPFTSTITKTINTNNAYGSGPNATIEIVLIGANLQDHSVDVSFGTTNYTANYSKIKVNYLNFSEPSQNLTSSTSITFSPTNGTDDRNTLAYIQVTYPHELNLNNTSQANLTIPDASTQTKSYLEIAGFNSQNTEPIMYDLTNHVKLMMIESGNLLKTLVPNSGGNKNCYLTSEAEVTTITNIFPAGNNGYFTDYSSIMADSAYLIISNLKLYDDGAGNNWVDEYGNYRQSMAGGSFDVVVADINELFDQFAFGIRKHPWAIRSYCEYAINHWPSAPSNLLLLGKSINSVACRNSAINTANNLVPTLGYPASDNLFSAYLVADSLYLPAIPTGRIAANNGEEIRLYLNKVIEYDNNPNYYAQTAEGKDWMKQILHFGGGGLTEQELFKTYLNNYEQTIEDTSYGGFVHSFFKNSSNPIQITISDSVKGLINNGVSMMTFFGHASGSGFDQNIDYPDSYSNTNGKYPFLLANSCLAGDIHLPISSSSISNSEQWVIHARGVIGFLASVGYGIPNLLNFYSDELYDQIGNNSYGQSIGQCIQNTIEQILPYPTLKKTSLGMTLHGDPAISLNTHSKPDYAITDNDVFFSPSLINTETDSFAINIIVSNIGKATNKGCVLEIIRNYPVESNTADSVINVIIDPAVYYKDTLTVMLPTDLLNGIGLNQFNIRVDASHLIDEETELNNDISNIPLLIKAADIIPVYPYDYSVVPTKLVVLKANTGNPFENIRNYKFELDTNNSFVSPLASTVIPHAGGVVNWDPSQDVGLATILNTMPDSTVYFWRTRWDSTSINDTNRAWRSSSFQYINGKTGWGQAHFQQLKSNQYNLMEYNEINQSIEFITTPKLLQCNSIGNASNTAQYLGTEYLIDGGTQLASSCNTPNAMLVAVIDPYTLVPWRTDNYDFGQVNGPPDGKCFGNGPHNAFVFWSRPQDSTYREEMANMLNSIPDSNYILVYTFRYGNSKQWEDTLYQAFQNLGSTVFSDSITAPPDNYPFAFFVKKGDLSTLQEITGSNPNDTVKLSANLLTNYDQGYITSTPIGVANSWHSIHWKFAETEIHDSVTLEVLGLEASGSETPIASLANLPIDSNGILINNHIDPSTFSQIKLRTYLKDDSLKTSPQLKRWHVLHDPVPELALNPSISFNFQSDTLEEGETLNFSTVVENISELDMDSVLISTWIMDNGRNYIPIYTKKYKPLLQSPDTLKFSVEYPTQGIPGNNSLWIEANPLDTATGVYDQPEQYHFNNIAELPFFVKGDGKNPLLDVTFDGVHILDGDIVSAKPQIVIQLSDENQFLALDTNSLLQVYITPPGSTIPELINYDQNTLRFTQAVLPNNKALVEYNPTFNEDGIYELRIQAQDVSKNSSGDLDYTITFEIINKATITEVFNWPNPFSTATHFVFTLTGSDVPQDFRIRIMTISGRVVKEIMAHELGPIHVGRNITQYAWDGTDEYGDRLANGIYLYKVDVRLDGEKIEKRVTSADGYIHKQYGKMYLLR